MSFLSPQWTLACGVLLSFFLPKTGPLPLLLKKWSTRILQFSVILLGASLNFQAVIKQGGSGALITFISIGLIFLLGFAGIKLFKLKTDLGILITMGTAICGGSAIAALAPVIAADSLAISLSMAIVFLLNAVAVFVFPPLAQALELSQQDFGMWAALAIHDTSSVVAAASIYGEEALSLATTVKLTRALWIIPITLLFSLYSSRQEKKKITVPWFIFGFVFLSLAFTFSPELGSLKSYFVSVSKTGLAITLFLIGMTFDVNKLKQVGPRPLLFGVGMWLIVSGTTLLYLMK